MTLRRAFEIQARACAALGSPFMATLMDLLANHWPKDSELGRLCADWPGDIGPGGASLPLRIAGGLHALVLTGRDAELAAVYPPQKPVEQELANVVLQSLSTHHDFLMEWLKSAPQTNEVRRSAVLIAAAHWLMARHPYPMVLSELGASAGLNLMWDRYALDTGAQNLGPVDPALTLSPDWTGPVPDPARITVADRRGVDLNPLNPHDPHQAMRLFAFLWPDQPHRRDLTRAAISAQTATVDKGDAIGWLEQRLDRPRDGHLHLIYHTVAWQYFPAQARERGAALIARAGNRATSDAPLAWFGMESDGATDGAALTMRLWPGNLNIPLGRADFHGRWVNWTKH